MENDEFEDLENDLASWLKPVRDGEGMWAKAMQRIDHVVDEQVRKAVAAEKARILKELPGMFGIKQT